MNNASSKANGEKKSRLAITSNHESQNPLLKYDLVYVLSFDALGPPKTADGGRTLSKTIRQLENVFKTGLTDRVNRISVAAETSRRPTSVNSNRLSSTNQGDEIHIGITLNAENASKLVERGPPADDKQAADSFKSFWGEKAELRRFKNGEILQCTVWKDGDYLYITKQITSFLLEKHFQLGKASYRVYGNNLAWIPEISEHLTSNSFNNMLASFHKLENDLRAMENLPLLLRHVQAVGSDLRCTSIQPPFHPPPNRPEPAEVLIQFEGSTRWPEDLQAIQMTKIAFLLKLSESFVHIGKSITAKVGMEDINHDLPTEPFVDIFYSSGANFRMRIHHDRIEPLLERRVGNKTLTPKDREDTGILLAKHRKVFLRRPRLAQALQRLTTKYPALSASTRLVKCWFNAHLLGWHFPEDLIEIIAAHAFLHSNPGDPPSSPMTVLLRTLLFLSTWDWEQEPLVVDFGGEMKRDDYAEAQTRFSAWRKIDPAMNRVALLVSTDFDADGTTWTDRRPTKVVAARMTMLARAAMQVVTRDWLDLELSSLFKSPLKDYHVCIHLKKEFARTVGESRTKSKYKNMQVAVDRELTLRLDLVKLFVHELEQLFGHVLMFFYDTRGGEVIAAVWLPYNSPRRWKANLPFSSIPLNGHDEDEEATVIVNRPSIVNDIGRLGADMIENIKVSE